MIKLLSNLKKTIADNLVILTYNLDLPFFEYMLFEPLYGAGCKNVVIICDPKQYQYCLKDITLLRYAGQRYSIIPSLTSPHGAFHPKMILLTSEESGKLLIGSGNLTKSGYIRNWEVFTHFEYKAGKSENDQDIRPFIWAYQQVSRILSISDKNNIGQPRLEQLVRTTPWLNLPVVSTPSPDYWLLNNLDKPLLGQFVNLYQQGDGSTVSEISLVSPFFDPGGRAVLEIWNLFHPTKLHIYSQKFEETFPPSIFKELERSTQVFAYRAEFDQRNLHAKTVMVKTQKGVWLVTGSANISTAAWLKTASKANTEFVLIRYEPDPLFFDAWFAELSQSAHPIPLEWPFHISQAKETESSVSILETVILNGNKIFLRLSGKIPDDFGNVIICFENSDQEELILPTPILDHQYTASMEISPTLVEKLKQPTAVYLICENAFLRTVTNSVLLHNSSEIEKFSQSAAEKRKKHPPIPPALDPEDTQDCVELMEELQELLATTKEKFIHHTRRIRPFRAPASDGNNDQPDIDEVYDPDKYLVDEIERPINPVLSHQPGEIYTNSLDQLTYDAILRSVRTAVNQFFQKVDVREGEDQYSPSGKEKTGDGKKYGNGKKPEDWTQKIEKGFIALIHSYIEGLEDSEYLKLVPIHYLLELQIIILTYFRMGWKRKNVSDNLFINLSTELLKAFWGTGYQVGAWQSINGNISGDEFQQESLGLNILPHLWLHAYILIQLQSNEPGRLFDLGSLLRSMRSIIGPPSDMMLISDDAFLKLWIQNIMDRIEIVSQREMIVSLERAISRYNIETLLKEISYSYNVKAREERISTAGIENIHCLMIPLPISREHYNDYLKTFLLYLNEPSRKKYAYAMFDNTNPMIDELDTRLIKMFYRHEENHLIVVRELANKALKIDIDLNINKTERPIQEISYESLVQYTERQTE